MSRRQPQLAVIGGGMGGLSTAIEAAGRGVAVTLYERAATLGGKLREVTVGEHRIDSGPTVFTMRWIFDALFGAVDRRLEDYVALHQASTLARHRWQDGSQLDLFAELDRSCDAIAAFSDASNANAYRSFVASSGQIFDTLDHSFMRAMRPGPVQLARNVGLRNVGDLLATKPFRSLWAELNHRFSDPRLVQLFARYATYCGSNPFLAPATLMLIAEAERRGVWYVQGGMQRLAEGLERLLHELGADIQTRSGVDAIERQRDGSFVLTVQGQQSPRFDAVVFNGDSQALASGALGETVCRATPARKQSGFSLSAVTWSLTGAISGNELSHHTVLFGSDYRREFQQLWHEQALPDSPTIYICAPELTNSSVSERPLFLLANAPSRPLDEAELEGYTERVQQAIAGHGVTIDWGSATAVRTTPNRFAELFPGSRGALYGRPTHGFAGSFSRPGTTTSVPGLFLAGGSVHPGAGVPMATQSGRLAGQAAATYVNRR